jgi:hypothetical protein
MSFYTIVPRPFEIEGGKRLSFLYLGQIASLKNFDHITKDANIFHLKSSDSYKLNYFLTSTL